MHSHQLETPRLSRKRAAAVLPCVCVCLCVLSNKTTAMNRQEDEFCLVEPLSSIDDGASHNSGSSRGVDGIMFGEKMES